MPDLTARPGVVQVVLAPLDHASAGDLALLNNDERARAARFVHERDRVRFVAAHAALRRVLGLTAGIAPEALRFMTTAHGKPQLIEAPGEIRFSLSRSGAFALIAVSRDIEVGVDIEEERPVEALELSRRFFAAAETAALEALPSADRDRAFFRVWTRKEAVVKARGDGLGFPLDRFDVSSAVGAAGQQLPCRFADQEPITPWQLVALDAPPGYAAALAGQGSGWRVEVTGPPWAPAVPIG
jgi:4'-phosphopantetheinyl transferase